MQRGGGGVGGAANAHSEAEGGGVVFQAEVASRDAERKRYRFGSNICGLWKWLVFKRGNKLLVEDANLESSRQATGGGARQHLGLLLSTSWFFSCTHQDIH